MARHSVSPDARLQAAAGWTARYLRKSGTALRVHLPFQEDLPSWAMDAGADLCVVSVHKMGAGLEQGSVFHLRGDLSDPAHLRSCADLLATTSPNTLIYAAMDGWRRQMVQHGHALLGGALALAVEVRERINALRGLHVLEDELLGAEASQTWTGSRYSPTYTTWASPATRPPTGCAPTGTRAPAFPTTGASSCSSASPTTARPHRHCWTRWQPCPGPPPTSPSRRR